MDLSNWVYLGVGVVLGIGGSWLFKSTDKTASPAFSDSTSNSQSQLIYQKLRQTQLAYQMAAEMCKFKAGFLARTSHELRSPLNGLIGAHQLVLAGLCDTAEEEHDFIEKANDSALKLVKLLDKLIGVSKTEHGTEEINIESVRLAEVFDAVEDLTQLLAKNRNFRLKIVFPDPTVYVLADRQQLIQVLVNLIDTSIYQMKEGTIYMSAHFSGAGFADICIDVPVSTQVWSEQIDLLKHQASVSAALLEINPELSPGMTLLTDQILLELMRGRLEVISLAPTSEALEVTRIQCSILLSTSETS